MKKNVKNIPTNDIADLFEIGVLPPEANLQLPDPQLVAYYKDSNDKRRMLYITRDIDDSLMDEIRCIIRWNIEDEENNIPVEERVPIKLLLLSYGGQIDMCQSMLDIIQLSRTKVICINLGVCASAASLILMAGHERYTLKNSWALIHQGQGSTGGTYAMVEAQSANYKRLIENMKNFILSHTKIDLKLYNKQKAKEWYLYDDTMVQLGVVDHVVDDISQIIGRGE